MSPLSEFDLVYLGTPYSKYPDGIEVAFQDAARLAARLQSQGISVFSPITHGHPMSVYGNIDPLDHEVWISIDRPFMDKADVLLVARLPSWKQSEGLHHEILHFMEVNKPIYLVNPETLEIESMAGWTILPLSSQKGEKPTETTNSEQP